VREYLLLLLQVAWVFNTIYVLYSHIVLRFKLALSPNMSHYKYYYIYKLLQYMWPV
jgi:hypothetical protein